MLLLLCCQCNSLTCRYNQTLYILGLSAPFPDDRLSFDVDTGGVGILPAVQLAIEHVNSRSDLLPGCHLAVLSGDPGCAVSSFQALEVLLEHLFTRQPKQVVGVLGPVCSTSATAIAPILSRKEVSLLHFTTAISPKVTGDKYITTIKMLGNSTIVVDALLELMEHNNWTRAGALFENEIEEFGLNHDLFHERASSRNHSILSLPVTDSYINLEPFEDNNIRIVFLFVSSDMASKILCLAYRKNVMGYPFHQWIIPDGSHLKRQENTTFRHEGKSISCTQAEIEQALSGAIVTKIRKVNRNATHRTYEHNQDKKLNGNSVVQDPNSDVYYDAVLSLALALNKTVHGERTFNLSGYTQGQPEATELLRREVLKLNFEGASGRIHFDNDTGSVYRWVDLFQKRTINPGSIIAGNKIFQIGSYSSENRSLVIYNGSFLEDDYPHDINRIHTAVAISVLVLTAIVLTLTIVLHILTVLLRERRVVKATSPNLNHLIFSGCYLFITVTVVLILRASFLRSVNSPVLYSVLCSMLGWCISIGYSLVMGTVCVKSFRIYRIFTGFKIHSRDKTGFLMTDNALTLFIMVFVTADMIVNTVWNAIAPWMVVLDETIIHHRVSIEIYCHCDYLVGWFIILIIFKVLLTLLTLYFAILSRRIKRKEFQFSRNINILAYAIILLYTLGIPVIFIFMDNLYVYTLIFCVISLLTVVFCQITLSVRPLYILLSSPCR